MPSFSWSIFSRRVLYKLDEASDVPLSLSGGLNTVEDLELLLEISDSPEGGGRLSESNSWDEEGGAGGGGGGSTDH